MFSTQSAQWNNTRQTLQLILTNLSQGLTFLTEFRDDLGKRLDDGESIEGQPYTVKEAILYAQRTARSFQALKLTKDKPIPGTQWQSALNAVTELADAGAALNSLAMTIKVEGRPVMVSSGTTVAVKETGDAIANFAGVASRLVSASDALINSMSVIYMAIRSSDLARNNQEAGVVTDEAKAAATAAIKAEEYGRSALEAFAKIDALVAQATAGNASAAAQHEAAHAETVAHQTEIAALLSELKTAAATAQENAAVISTRMTDVTALKAQMESSNAALTSFNSNLGATRDSVDAARQKAETVIADFDSKKDEIARMLNDAEHMLSASTVAGLATAFDSERTSLDRSLLWAQRWFGVGIITLTIATIPLLLYVSNVQFGMESKSILPTLTSEAATYQISIAGAISRGFVILGPFWLTLFSARRYRSLFELRQQYSHKYNMAFSMEGFKKQAPEFAENIAAWVFSIVAASPVQQKPGGPMDEVPSTSFKDFGEVVIDQFRRLFGLKPAS